tara:strand:+ start:173 stop:727 length:555 start_codon:yes stop_codon:yes gene_type:complete
MKLLLNFFLILLSSSVFSQELIIITNHDNKAVSELSYEVIEKKSQVLINSAAFKDTNNLITGLNQIGEFKYILDKTKIDDSKNTEIDNLDLSSKERLYVVKNNISDNVVFTKGKLIVYVDNPLIIDELNSEFSNDLILESKSSKYGIFQVVNIKRINNIIEILSRDARTIGVQLDVIDPNRMPQ